MFAEALSEFEKALELSPESTDRLSALGHGYAILGKRNEAIGMLNKLNELSKEKYVSSYDIAAIYSALGEKERAFAYLENAYDERSGYLAYIKVDPRVDSLRSDPRFASLLRKMNLE